jgi:exodeoxyribonuclease V beta subunit
MKNLDAETIPLQGRHIIEASAGTGKTYNITELYIRLLLDRKLSPKNILVMTFTKDATQEIISRVEEKIRDELKKYDDTTSEDGFELEENAAKRVRDTQEEQDCKLLKKALLEVDEAAIFTIHGFCKRVLSQQAFTSGLEMDVSMEVDTDDILLEVVEDYFRKYINTDAEKFSLLQVNKWHTPEKFLDRDAFKNVIKSGYDIEITGKEVTTESFLELKRRQLELFQTNQPIVEKFLEKAKTAKEPEGLRVKEYYRIIEWLENDDIVFPQNISIITHGNKTKGDDVKPVFIGVKELKDLAMQILLYKVNKLVASICQDIRADFIEAKAKKSVLDFDDLIVQLRNAVYNSSELVENLQKEYPVALIDEFQDTDVIQYEILDRLYPLAENLNDSVIPDTDPESLGCVGSNREILNQVQHDGHDFNTISHSHAGGNLNNPDEYSKDTRLHGYDESTKKPLLLMIGDPKQAIYGFRGGDIFTYLKAKKSAEYSWSMDTNWRSTQGIVSSYNRLFYTKDYTQADFDSQNDENNVFSQGISYQLIKSTENAKVNKELIAFDDDLKAMNYFCYEEKVTADSGRKVLSQWTANEIVKLLNTDKVKEKDIAILVQNGSQAKAVRLALQRKKLNSVYLSQRDSIYESIEADEILSVLRGIAECENDSLLKQALSTSLMGGTAEKFVEYLDEENPAVWDSVKDEALKFRSLWRKQSVMSLLLEVLHTKYTPRVDENARSLTNFLHIAELLKVAENRYKQPLQLIKWYKDKLQNKSSNEENTLRLESDSNLIKIVTIHGSKGLEYPIVFVPFATFVNSKTFNEKNINKYYNQEHQKTVYSIGKDAQIKAQVDNEIVEESQRLLYVAITRASQRCYIGVANFDKCELSPLAQFLGFEKGNQWQSLLQDIAQKPDNNSQVISFDSIKNSKLLIAQEQDKEVLTAKEFKDEIERSWGMLSFSSMVRDNKPYEYSQDDKSSDEEHDDISKVTKLAELEYRFTANKGSDIGNLLHGVLEESDFSKGIAREKVDEFINRNLGAVNGKAEAEDIQSWLEECLEAPIPSLDGGESFKLKDLGANQVLKEPEFYFPIDNNDLWKTKLAEVLSQYRGEPAELPSNSKLHGMLHGFIDLIFSHNGKFFVADYKSNYLGDSLRDYTQEAMSAKNQSSFYDLQYLIYCVALHRYLTINKKDYDFDNDFGGVYYLYLRGMKDGFGVYSKKLTKDIVLKLDNLFRGDENV